MRMELLMRMIMKDVIAVVTTQIPMTIQKPHHLPSKGTPTFIPHKLAINVGTEMMSVMTASSFITTFRLFEMTEAYASIVPDKMSR